MALLKVTEVFKKEGQGFAIEGISFTQQPLQKIAVAGETGSGKTTLLKMIAGLQQPDGGTICFENKKVIGPHEQLIPGHKGIAYLSQYFELPNHYWVHEILSYANTFTQEAADSLYAVCRIDHLLNRRTSQLSGGEKQRIALARLLSGAPRLLLLDEPFSNLDAPHKEIIKSVIRDIGSRLHISCIMASHDAADILSWADTILVIKDGKLLQQGDVRDVYDHPVDSYCAGLLGAYNILNPANAALFYPEVRATPKQNILLRPAQIFPGRQGNVEAVLQQIHFMGSHTLAEVQANGQLLTVSIPDKQYRQGDKFKLSVLPGLPWYV